MQNPGDMVGELGGWSELVLFSFILINLQARQTVQKWISFW